MCSKVKGMVRKMSSSSSSTNRSDPGSTEPEVRRSTRVTKNRQTVSQVHHREEITSNAASSVSAQCVSGRRCRAPRNMRENLDLPNPNDGQAGLATERNGELLDPIHETAKDTNNNPGGRARDISSSNIETGETIGQNQEVEDDDRRCVEVEVEREEGTELAQEESDDDTFVLPDLRPPEIIRKEIANNHRLKEKKRKERINTRREPADESAQVEDPVFVAEVFTVEGDPEVPGPSGTGYQRPTLPPTEAGPILIELSDDDSPPVSPMTHPPQEPPVIIDLISPPVPASERRIRRGRGQRPAPYNPLPVGTNRNEDRRGRGRGRGTAHAPPPDQLHVVNRGTTGNIINDNPTRAPPPPLIPQEEQPSTSTGITGGAAGTSGGQSRGFLGSIVDVLKAFSNGNGPATPSPPSPASGSKASILCPICLDNYSTIKAEGHQMMSMCCGHLLCDVCLQNLVQRRQKFQCPTCRKPQPKGSAHPIYF